jgi:hypothetical protein
MERNADFKVALAVLAVVLAIVSAIVAIRVTAAGSLSEAFGEDGGLSAFRNWWSGDDDYDDDCMEYAESLADGPYPYEEELSSRGEHMSETVDGYERGWSLNIRTYGDERAATRTLEGLRQMDGGFEACFPDEITAVNFPVAVIDGHGSGYAGMFEGEREQSLSAAWRRGHDVVEIDFWSSSADDVAAWVRAEYDEIRERVESGR